MGYGFGIEDIGLQVVVRLWIFPSVGYQRVGRLVDLFTRKRTADRRIGFLNFELRGDFFDGFPEAVKSRKKAAPKSGR